MTDRSRTNRPGQLIGPSKVGTPAIEGRVDPRAIEAARQALGVKMAKGTIKTMAGRDDGARQVAETLRRWLRD